MSPGSCVQVSHIGPSQGDPDAGLAAPTLVGTPPVTHKALPSGFVAVSERDPSLLPVCGDCCGDVAVTQLVERGDLPLLGLATILGQLNRAESARECAEQPAGIDLRKL